MYLENKISSHLEEMYHHWLSGQSTWLSGCGHIKDGCLLKFSLIFINYHHFFINYHKLENNILYHTFCCLKKQKQIFNNK